MAEGGGPGATEGGDGRRQSAPGGQPEARSPLSTVGKSLWSNRDFNIFWLVQTFSVLGSSFSLIALPLLVLQATGSAAQMGLLTAVSSVGSICTGFFVGRMVDRRDRRKILISCDSVRTVLYGLVPICWIWGPHVWLLYIVMVSAAVFDMLFQITYVTAVANLVDKSQITDANGRLQTTYAIAYIAGPALAGLVSGFFGPTTAISADAATFAVSAVGMCFVRLRIPENSVASRESLGGRSMPWSGFISGIRFLWRIPVMRWLTLLLTVLTFLSLGLTDVFIYYVRHVIKGSDQEVGYVLGLASVGSIVGASVASALRKWWGFGASWLGSYILCGVSVIAIGLSSQLALVAGMAMVFSLGSTLAGVCSMSLRQEITPDHMLGRVTSAFWTVHSSLGPIGAAVLTAAVDRLGVKGPLIVVGGIFLLLVLVGVFTPVRQRHPELGVAAG